MAPKHTSPLQTFLVNDAFDGEVFVNEPMARHTTYRIGGPARFFVRADSVHALSDLVRHCEESGVKWYIVGRGSNLLVSDEGIDGVVITLGRDFKNYSIDEEDSLISAGAAVPLSSIVQEALRNSFAGMEFAVGTPGNMGGALRMNAGSKDDWIGSRVRSVTTFSPQEGLVKHMGDQIDWGYRRTSFKPEQVILECELLVEKGDPFFIQGKMEANLSKRKKSQPLGEPSCGSVFRNPPGHSAAKLIDELGLKGRRIGNAEISTKHANFIVNKGGAKASDVLALIQLAATEVEKAHGIKLTPEVRFLGF